MLKHVLHRQHWLRKNYSAIFCKCVLLLVSATAAVAEPAVDVALKEGRVLRHYSESLHFAALKEYYEISEAQRSPAVFSAAAHSAWALGLSTEARAIWKEQDVKAPLQGVERARDLLSRGILEYQDNNYTHAIDAAQAAAALLNNSPLRAQCWLLIGEAFRESRAFQEAMSFYERAQAEGDEVIQEEAAYLLGELQFERAQFTEAAATLARVAESELYAAKALEYLAAIAFRRRQHAELLQWLQQGEQFDVKAFRRPRFIYYTSVALLGLGRLKDAEQTYKDAAGLYSENNTWLLLANAAIEAGRLEAMRPKPLSSVDEASELARVENETP